MSDKSKLEKTLEYALNGVPQIKGQEKRKYLGEFRERVILALTIEQGKKMEALLYAREALKDPEAEILIVNNKIPIEIMRRYMQLAKEEDKEYKTVATSESEAMGVVIASRNAVDRENITIEIQEIPLDFKKASHKELCPQCFERLCRLKNFFKKVYSSFFLGQ